MIHPLHHPNNIWWRLQIMKLFIYGFLRSSVTSHPSVQTFSSALSSQESNDAWSYVRATDQVSHPYKITGEIKVLYVWCKVFPAININKVFSGYQNYRCFWDHLCPDHEGYGDKRWYRNICDPQPTWLIAGEGFIKMKFLCLSIFIFFDRKW
jgi:hypothetical protein